MGSTKKTTRPASWIKSGIFLFILFHIIKAFSPPALHELTMETARTITLQELVTDINRNVDSPVVIDEVRVVGSIHFYFGSAYYVESLDGNNRLLVLSRKYPPQKDDIIKVLGGIQPVISVNKINLAFFKQAAVQYVIAG